MIFVVDIGNTKIKMGIFSDNQLIENNDFDLYDEFENHIKNKIKKEDSICISSVVPKLTKKLKKNKLKINEMIFVDHINSQLKLNVDLPESIGADRLCNISAAFNLYNFPIIIIDFGTANTYDVVDENGSFIGGAISPGVETSGQYLIDKAALLDKTQFEFPSKVIGTTTKTNIQSGIMYGTVSQIEGMIEKIKVETQNNNFLILLTGGFGKIITNKLSVKHIYDEHLTLKGIFNIYNNHSSNEDII